MTVPMASLFRNDTSYRKCGGGKLLDVSNQDRRWQGGSLVYVGDYYEDIVEPETPCQPLACVETNSQYDRDEHDKQDAYNHS